MVKVGWGGEVETGVLAHWQARRREVLSSHLASLREGKGEGVVEGGAEVASGYLGFSALEFVPAAHVLPSFAPNPIALLFFDPLLQHSTRPE